MNSKEDRARFPKGKRHPMWKHGGAEGGVLTTEYNIWSNMKDRCYRTHNRYFHRYGGRGIVVCDEWKHSFAQFFKDMGPRPSARYTLDRIDNDGPYSKENCRWATVSDQQNNRCNNVVVTFAGKTQTLTQWSAELGVDPSLVSRRLRYGWSPERALTIPPRKTGFAVFPASKTNRRARINARCPYCGSTFLKLETERQRYCNPRCSAFDRELKKRQLRDSQ